MAIDTELEAELLPQLQRQDDTSFNRLVRLYSGVMLSLARSIVGDAIADEVVQEAWLSAYRALPKFEGRSSLKTWLLRITANQARTRLRKENRSVAMDALSPGGEGVLQGRFAEDGHWRIPPSGWHDDSPEALLTRREMGDCIELTMARLPDLQQSVFVLKDLEQYGFDEICNILEISASNARVLLHRARLSLFGKIEHFQESGEC